MPNTTNYIWDEMNFLAEADGTNMINVVYTNEPQQYGNLVSIRGANTTSYYNFDATGTIREITNSSRSKTGHALYDAWGSIIQLLGVPSTGLLWLGEVGYFLDIETSLISSRLRYFAPLLARWTSIDPIFSTVPYLYCSNRPIALQDPSGAAPARRPRTLACGVTYSDPVGVNFEFDGKPGNPFQPETGFFNCIVDAPFNDRRSCSFKLPIGWTVDDQCKFIFDMYVLGFQRLDPAARARACASLFKDRTYQSISQGLCPSECPDKLWSLKIGWYSSTQGPIDGKMWASCILTCQGGVDCYCKSGNCGDNVTGDQFSTCSAIA
jgi:RHS repeat-associated protein